MKNYYFLITFAVIAFSISSCKNDNKVIIPTDCTDVHWSYDGSTDGQDKWVDLCTGYSDCGGQSQSPINISGSIPDLTLPGLDFNYSSTTTEIENNGHTIEFVCEAGSELTIGTKTYQLLQFHYHAKSEHQVDGSYHSLEVHFVHKASDTDYAVVGVFFEPGEENELFTEFLAHFPTEKGTYTDTTEINLAGLLPENKSFYHYSGSLTTPPCSEVVNWYVLKNEISASATQIAQFEGILKNNYRDIRNLNGRTIYSRDE